MKTTRHLASPLRDNGPEASAAEPLPAEPLALALRAVHRVASELRRGTPVLVRGPEGAIVIAAAETVSARGLSEIAVAARGTVLLLLAPVRAAAVLHRPVPQTTATPLGAPPEMGVVALRLPSALLRRTGALGAGLHPPINGPKGYFFFGRTASTSLWGRAMTWTLTISPLMALMAWAPASVAAFTAATSPTTTAVTSALPTCVIGPASSTFAALSMASVPSTKATRPRVSIIPIACCDILLLRIDG